MASASFIRARISQPAGAAWWKRAPATSITVNPGEVHDGAPIGDSGRSWSMLYFDRLIVLGAFADMREGASHGREFPSPVVIDARAAAMFAAAIPDDDRQRLRRLWDEREFIRGEREFIRDARRRTVAGAAGGHYPRMRPRRGAAPRAGGDWPREKPDRRRAGGPDHARRSGARMRLEPVSGACADLSGRPASRLMPISCSGGSISPAG